MSRLNIPIGYFLTVGTPNAYKSHGHIIFGIILGTYTLGLWEMIGLPGERSKHLKYKIKKSEFEINY